jgi:hypothetical protein
MAKLVLSDRTVALFERGLAALALLTWLLLICSGSVGCSGRQPLASHRFDVDKSVTDAQLAIVQQASYDLCEMTSGARCFDFARGPVPTQNTLRVAPLPGNTWGETTWTEDYVEIVVIDHAQFASTFRHELGHAAGCWTHLPPKNVITYSTTNQGLWTALDIECVLEEWSDD